MIMAAPEGKHHNKAKNVSFSKLFRQTTLRTVLTKILTYLTFEMIAGCLRSASTGGPSFSAEAKRVCGSRKARPWTSRQTTLSLLAKSDRRVPTSFLLRTFSELLQALRSATAALVRQWSPTSEATPKKRSAGLAFSFFHHQVASSFRHSQRRLLLKVFCCHSYLLQTVLARCLVPPRSWKRSCRHRLASARCPRGSAVHQLVGWR